MVLSRCYHKLSTKSVLMKFFLLSQTYQLSEIFLMTIYIFVNVFLQLCGQTNNWKRALDKMPSDKDKFQSWRQLLSEGMLHCYECQNVRHAVSELGSKLILKIYVIQSVPATWATCHSFPDTPSCNGVSNSTYLVIIHVKYAGHQTTITALSQITPCCQLDIELEQHSNIKSKSSNNINITIIVIYKLTLSCYLQVTILQHECVIR